MRRALARPINLKSHIHQVPSDLYSCVRIWGSTELNLYKAVQMYDPWHPPS
jgi:hypothetical protein